MASLGCHVSVLSQLNGNLISNNVLLTTISKIALEVGRRARDVEPPLFSSGTTTLIMSQEIVADRMSLPLANRPAPAYLISIQ